MKKTYEAPKMEKLGSFEELTLNTSSGSRLDSGFVVGAPLADQPVS
ncbi:MAG: lasso RiPP family leader peptide-containing protein [Pseudomonadota bacterium]